MIRFEIEEEIKHRLLGGHDEISITLQNAGGDRRLRERSPGRWGADDLALSDERVGTQGLGRRHLRPRLDATAGLGGAVVDRLGLRGDETVLDAGCGSGRVTQLLLDRLPEGE